MVLGVFLGSKYLFAEVFGCLLGIFFWGATGNSWILGFPRLIENERRIWQNVTNRSQEEDLNLDLL